MIKNADHAIATYTCRKTGITITAEGLFGAWGAMFDSDPDRARVRLTYQGSGQWTLEADNRDTSSNFIPMGEWHGTTLTVDLWEGLILVIQEDDIRELLEAAADLCPALKIIQEGHVVEWDGSNHVGHLAKGAMAEIERVEDPENPVTVREELERLAEKTFTAEEWLQEDLSDRRFYPSIEDLRQEGLAAELAEIAAGEDVRIVGSIQEVIDKAIDRRENDAHDALYLEQASA